MEKSLAAIPAGKLTQESLANLDDHHLQAMLGHVVSGLGTTEGGDPDRTASYSVGAATSDGQRFRIVRPHARGGLGAVFVALDGELHREVALKQILDHHADDPTSRSRFVLEAEITGGLGASRHRPGLRPGHLRRRPALLRHAVHPRRQLQGGHRPTSMPMTPCGQTPAGESLGLLKLLRRFLDVCNAIDYAAQPGHLAPRPQAGQHHRRQARRDAGGRLGTGQGRWGEPNPGSPPTSGCWSHRRPAGRRDASRAARLGTPAYMSPEQAGGDLEHLGPRSDVYSLGATLYCLLTGKPPFESDDAGTVLRAVQRGDFPPPRRLDPSIDPALEAVCLKAMALKPEDRYATPRMLAEDIEHWMADEPVAAWREPLRGGRGGGRGGHRTAVTAATAAVLVALAGMAAVLGVQARANSRTDEIERRPWPRPTSRERARFALAMDAVKLFHGEVSEDFLLKEKPFEALRTKLLQGAAGFYGKLQGLLAGQTDRPSRTALALAYDELAELTDKIGSMPEALAVRRRRWRYIGSWQPTGKPMPRHRQIWRGALSPSAGSARGPAICPEHSRCTRRRSVCQRLPSRTSGCRPSEGWPTSGLEGCSSILAGRPRPRRLPAGAGDPAKIGRRPPRSHSVPG